MPPIPSKPKGGGLGALLRDPAKRRTALLVLGAGVALLILLRSRQKPVEPADQTETDPSQAAATGTGPGDATLPSTFADNGAQAATLGNAVTEGLGGVATALGSQSDAFNALAELLGEPASRDNSAQTGNPTTGPASPPAAGTTAKPSAAGKVVAGLKVPSAANKRAWSPEFRKRYTAAGGDAGYVARQLEVQKGLRKSAAPPALAKPKPAVAAKPPAKAPAKVGSPHNTAPKPSPAKAKPKPKTVLVGTKKR